jgi:hypothetical protein
MLLHRVKFFLALSGLIAAPLLINKFVWLARSKKTAGVFSFQGGGNALDQMRMTHSILYFNLGKDTIWFEAPSNLDLQEGQAVSVRYQPANPSDVRLNTFLGIWGATAIYGGIPLFVLLIIFLHPEIVPYSAKLRLTRKKPFVFIVPKEDGLLGQLP